jgi:hypothetical protein
MPTSPTQTAANQANAQHSTGPRSDGGKAITRFNSFKHGLTSQTCLLPWEDHEAYSLLHENHEREMKPLGEIEIELVRKIADTTWRLRRMSAQENNLFALSAIEDENTLETGDQVMDDCLAQARVLRDNSKSLVNISLYEVRLNRILEKAYDRFIAIKSLRVAAQRARADEQAIAGTLSPEKVSPKNGFACSNPEADQPIKLSHPAKPHNFSPSPTSNAA